MSAPHGWTITGLVRGCVNFPDHPDHTGHGGLVGGEDIYASRETFASVGQAMTWCRKVLEGHVKPRSWQAWGDLLTPMNGPHWNEATVVARRFDGETQEWETGPNDGWYESRDGGTRLGKQVRDDRELTGAPR